MESFFYYCIKEKIIKLLLTCPGANTEAIRDNKKPCFDGAQRLSFHTY